MNVTDDRQTTDGRATANSEREHGITFAKSGIAVKTFEFGNALDVVGWGRFAMEQARSTFSMGYQFAQP